MRSTLTLRKFLISIAMFALLCVVLVVMDRRALLDPVREGMGTILDPVLTRVEQVGRPDPPSEPLDVQLATAVAERDALRAENARLQGQVNDLETLQDQVQVEQQYPDLDFMSARVVNSDPSGTQDTIVINRGSDDGIQIGMAVVDPNYYVGQVIEVERQKSKVLLITDSSASVGCQLYSSRADGVIYGSSGNGQLTMRHVAKDTVTEDQDWIMTSDQFESETAQVPPNLLIGYVVGEPVLNQQTDQLEITVQPAADFRNLETVWIVVPS